ncbi:hypothetical protein D3C78_1058270 [compost metagenome]
MSGAFFVNFVSRFFAEEAFFSFQGFLIGIITFCGRRQVNVMPCGYTNVFRGKNLRGLRIDIASGDNHRVTAAGDFGCLLAYGLVDNRFLARLVAVALAGLLGREIHIASGL